jgi:small conductance mechanosensitive channel
MRRMDSLLEQFHQFTATHAIPFGYKLVAALLTLLIGRWIASRMSRGLDGALRKRLDPTVASFLGNALHVALLAVVIVAALDQVGVQTTSLLAIFGAAGLAVGLALKDSLGNFASGVMLILFRPFRVGHFVEAGGASGTVKEIRIFATVLTTPDNKVVTVPNGSIMGGNITNYSEMPTRRVDMSVGVGYSSDLAQVKRVIEGILAADERVLKEPAPVVAVSTLGDSSIQIVVRPWVKSADYFGVLWDFTETVKRRFDEEGIEIPFPRMDVRLADAGALLIQDRRAS